MSRLDVRDARESDVDEMAALLEAAWQETYAGLLPDTILRARNRDQDADDLRDLVRSPTPHGAIVAVREGSAVGLATYGRPNHTDGRDLVEIYAMYARRSEAGTGAGRRLLVRTISHARRAGAEGLIWYVHAGNTTVRERIEKRGLSPSAGPLSRRWYGHPVEVYEYRFDLSTRGGSRGGRS